MNDTVATASIAASFTPDDHDSMIHDEERSRMTANDDVPLATPFVDRTPTDPPRPPPADGLVGTGVPGPYVSIDLEEPSNHQQFRANEHPSDTTKSPKKPSSNSDDSSKNATVPVRKSSILVVFMLLFATMGVAIYFFMHWYNPSLAPLPNRGGSESARIVCEVTKEVECDITSDDVNALQIQIDMLTEQNKQLAEQLVEYDELNDRLNASIVELKEQNQILSDSNDDYEALNDRLEATVEDLKEETAFLTEQVETFADLNEQLNVTADRLEEQVDELEEQVDKLSAENDRLDVLVDELDDQISALTDLNDLLEDNVDKLEEQVDELTIENDRLEVSVDNLQTIASFLNETAGNLDETYEQVAEHLADMIATNRMLVLETIENTYHQRVANWDCSFIDTFALEVFANDFNAPIPDANVAEVMEYVNERVLSDLCLSQANFEQYVDDRYNGGDITTNRLVASVQRYTFDAMEYYFPDPDEAGLTANDWAEADYKCENFAAQQQYIGV